MSGIRLKEGVPFFAPQIVNVLNAQAEQLDDCLSDIRIHDSRLDALEARVGKLEPTVPPKIDSWRPMETAPRDGQWVLVRSASGFPPEVVKFGHSMWIDSVYRTRHSKSFIGWHPIPGEGQA